MGHLGLEPAYDSRTVKKWAAAAGHFRFYYRNGARAGCACEFVEIKKDSVRKRNLYENWAILDLNQGPKDYESSALTTELMARNDENHYIINRLL